MQAGPRKPDGGAGKWALGKGMSRFVDVIADLLDGILDRPDDPHFYQQHDQKSVKQRDRQITAQAFSGIRLVGLADDFRAALLHEDKAEEVGEPISQDETGGEGRFVEPACDPGASQGQRLIDKEVVPPGERREHVADEGQSAAGDFPFCDPQLCHARGRLAKPGLGRHVGVRIIGVWAVPGQIRELTSILKKHKY